MSYPTCKTCKYYEENPDHWKCMGGLCMNRKISSLKPLLPNEASYGDNDGDKFWVGPDFGCIHHEVPS